MFSNVFIEAIRFSYIPRMPVQEASTRRLASTVNLEHYISSYNDKIAELSKTMDETFRVVTLLNLDDPDRVVCSRMKSETMELGNITVDDLLKENEDELKSSIKNIASLSARLNTHNTMTNLYNTIVKDDGS